MQRHKQANSIYRVAIARFLASGVIPCYNYLQKDPARRKEVMSRLFLVRHGETALKSSQRLWGQTDVELSEMGIRQAEKLRDRLTTEQFDSIYSSDLKRALVTARTIAAKHNTEVTSLPELREFNYGRVEGLTFAEMEVQYPDCARSLLEQDTDIKFPDGESLMDMVGRVGKFAAKLKDHPGEEKILIVVHSGVLRTLICQLLGMDLKHIFQFLPELASLSIVNTYRGAAILNLFNDISHLDHLPRD